MLSLYDYLGRPAGKALGWAVGRQASIVGAHVETRYVENAAYKGNVNLYNEEVLKVFFKNPTNKAIIAADEKAYRERQIRRRLWEK
jgi:hypothetical protein